jgi:hypothetical protein
VSADRLCVSRRMRPVGERKDESNGLVMEGNLEAIPINRGQSFFRAESRQTVLGLVWPMSSAAVLWQRYKLYVASALYKHTTLRLSMILDLNAEGPLLKLTSPKCRQPPPPRLPFEPFLDFPILTSELSASLGVDSLPSRSARCRFDCFPRPFSPSTPSRTSLQSIQRNLVLSNNPKTLSHRVPSVTSPPMT